MHMPKTVFESSMTTCSLHKTSCTVLVDRVKHLHFFYIICEFIFFCWEVLYLQVATLAVQRGRLRAACSFTFLLIWGPIYCYTLLISSMNVDVICEFLWWLLNFNKRPEARGMRHIIVRILPQLLPDPLLSGQGFCCCCLFVRILPKLCSCVREINKFCTGKRWKLYTNFTFCFSFQWRI